jgi:hypothetical protein
MARVLAVAGARMAVHFIAVHLRSVSWTRRVEIGTTRAARLNAASKIGMQKDTTQCDDVRRVKCSPAPVLNSAQSRLSFSVIVCPPRKQFYTITGKMHSSNEIFLKI